MPKRTPLTFLKKYWVLFSIPVLFWFIDLFFRYHQLSEFNGTQLFIYLSSLFVSAGYIVFVLLLILRSFRIKLLFYSLISFLFPIWIFSFFGSYKFESMNGVFPNYHTILFIKEEPYSAWTLAVYSVEIWIAVVFVIIILGLNILLRKYIKSFVPYIKNKYLLLYFILQLLAFEAIGIFYWKYDQCAISDVNLACNIQRALFDFSDYSRPGGGLKTRNPYDYKISPELKKTKNYNVLLVIFESARKRTMGLYNRDIPTTPFLNSFEEKYSKNFYKFLEPKTIATSTMLAVPAILNGIGPYQSPSKMFSQPLTWEYAHRIGYKTFFLSSHYLGMFDFDDFYKKNNLDHYYCQDNADQPLFNELGMDDIHATNKLKELLSQYKEEPFYGVIQYNTTHYPYTAPENYMKWGDDEIMDKYYNSMYYQDDLIRQVIEHMEEKDLMKNTIILFVSDHSEAIEEHKNIGHLESNYIETIDIPLFMYVPDNMLSTEELKALKNNTDVLCSNIDVAPTIVDLFDLEKDTTLQSMTNNYTGYSLLKPIPKDRYVITFNSNSYGNFNTGISIINHKWHYLYRTNVVPNREEIFLWKSDPTEMQDYIFLMNDSLRQSIALELEKYEESYPYGKLIREKIFKGQ